MKPTPEEMLNVLRDLLMGREPFTKEEMEAYTAIRSLISRSPAVEALAGAARRAANALGNTQRHSACNALGAALALYDAGREEGEDG